MYSKHIVFDLKLRDWQIACIEAVNLVLAISS